MPSQEIKSLLEKLHQALSTVEGVDPQTTQVLRKLDEDINQILETEPEPMSESVMDRARDLESQFAAHYPSTEQFIRELVDALGRFGV